MANDRHSYVPFYPSDWIAGTHRLPRLVRSIYFDVCLFNWDYARPCPPAEMALMLADVPDWEQQIDLLVNIGKLVRTPDGSVFSQKALAVAKNAFDLWEKKSKGGKSGASGRWKDGRNQGDMFGANGSPMASANGEPEPEPEPEPDYTPLTPQGGDDGTPMDDESIPDADRLLNAWNAEAPRWGWPRVTKFTETRRNKARLRIKTYGIDGCLKAVKRAGMAGMFNSGDPPQWFTFDFIVRNDESIAKIMEGKYDRDFRRKGSSWNFD